jgi:hypothetical protein
VTDPYNTLSPLPFDTIEFELSEAMRASLAAAREAYERGYIKQREVSPGIFVLVRS